MLSIIVAKAKNNVIGKNNELLWYIPDDLKRFKKLTEYHTIIMGRKTFDSIGRVLPNRKHVILTHNLDFTVDDENVEIVHNLQNIQNYIDSPDECFVIGGGLIYNMLLPFAKKLYITEIDKSFEGDTLFPKISETVWEEVERIPGPQDERIPYKYEYVTYVRK